MPSVEITSNAINFAVPMHLNGNLGIGTSIPLGQLHTVGNAIISGCIGVGTSTPSSSLHVVGTLSVQGNVIPTACNVYDLGSANYRFRDLYLSGNTIDLEGTKIMKDADTGGISVKTATNELVDTTVRNLIADNIGVGTTAPTQRLDVVGTVKATAFSGSGALLTSLDVANVSAGTLSVARGGTGASTLTANKLMVGNGTSAITLPTSLHWDNANSRLGIGSTQPTQTLDVSGNARVQGDLMANTITSSNLYVVGDVVTMNTLSSNTEQMIITNEGTGPALKVIQTGTLAVHSVAEFIDAETGTAMIISNGGSVGIGTTSPTTSLDVNGSVKASSFVGSGALLTSLDVANVSAGTLSVARGGTGASTLTANKLIVGNGTSAVTQPTDLHWDNTNSRLGIGSTQPTQTLDVIGTVKATSFSGSGALLTSLDVANVSAGTLSVARGGTGASTLTTNKLLVGNGTSAVTQPTNLHWDNANSRLGIGSTQPTQTLDVSGNSIISGNVGIGTTTPTQKLDVNGIIRNKNPYLLINGNGGAVSHNNEKLKFNVALYDNMNGYNTSTYTYTVKATGIYLIQLNVYINSVGTGARYMLYINNNTYAILCSATGNSELEVSGSIIVPLNLNDTVDFRTQTSTIIYMNNIALPAPSLHSYASLAMIG